MRSLTTLVLTVGLITACSSEPAPPSGDTLVTDTATTDTGEEPDVSATDVSDAAMDVEDVELDDVSGDEDVEPDTGSCTPRAPAEVDGYPSDGWAWERTAPLFPDFPLDTVAPAVAWLGDALVLVFTSVDAGEHQLWGARSEDLGETWSVPVRLEGIPDDVFNAYPSLWSEDGELWLYWMSGGMHEARSSDGLTWEVTREGILTLGEEGAFDAAGILYPDVQRSPEGWSVLYTGWDMATYRIGEATSADGETWTRQGVVYEATEGWDNTAVGQARRLPGRPDLVWYGGYDTSRTNPGPWRVGLAERAGEWSPQGVSLGLRPGEPDAWSTRDPAVIVTPDGLLMVYVGMGEDSRLRLLSATSSTCLPSGL